MKTNTFENVNVYSCADMPHHERHVCTPDHVVMSVIAYVSIFFKLCMHITRDGRLTNIIIEAYLHVHYDYVFTVFITIFMAMNAYIKIKTVYCQHLPRSEYMEFGCRGVHHTYIHT